MLLILLSHDTISAYLFSWLHLQACTVHTPSLVFILKSPTRKQNLSVKSFLWHCSSFAAGEPNEEDSRPPSPLQQATAPTGAAAPGGQGLGHVPQLLAKGTMLQKKKKYKPARLAKAVWTCRNGHKLGEIGRSLRRRWGRIFVEEELC